MSAARATGLALLAVVAAMVALPWLGPALGLDDYRDARRPAETPIELPGGHTVNVEMRGEGPVVVLVHGLPGDAGQVAELAGALVERGFRAIHYDRVGWGWSSRRPAEEPATLEQNARELLALVETLELEPSVWLGFSYGGGVAQHAAALAPERVRALVLLASVGPAQERPPPGRIERLVFSRPVLAWAHATGATARAFSAGAMRGLFAPEMEPPRPLVDRFLAGTSMPGAADTWIRESRAPRTFVPEQIRVPTLLLHGTGDGAVPVEVGRDLARRIRGARLIEVEGASHALPLTQPTLIAAHVAEFAADENVIPQGGVD